MKYKFLMAVLVMIACVGVLSAQDGKKNSRPVVQEKPAAEKTESDPKETKYFYRFTQPNFTVSKIELNFVASGNGTISFWKGTSPDAITDPLTVSAQTIAQIDRLLADLDYFNSDKDYQYSKDYSHLGVSEITIRSANAERTVKYNWTDDANAKELAAVFRRLANQYIWMFDIGLSRENQPLQSPKLMESLDSMMRRGDIADPEQMIPFLRELADDERIPLMARNRSLKIIKDIEKRNGKK